MMEEEIEKLKEQIDFLKFVNRKVKVDLSGARMQIEYLNHKIRSFGECEKPAPLILYQTCGKCNKRVLV